MSSTSSSSSIHRLLLSVCQHKSKNPKKIFSDGETLRFEIHDFCNMDLARALYVAFEGPWIFMETNYGFGQYSDYDETKQAVVVLFHDNTIQEHSPSANVSLRCSNDDSTSKSFTLDCPKLYGFEKYSLTSGLVSQKSKSLLNGTVTIEADIRVEKKGTYYPQEIVSDPFRK